jgi:hypothetical protein
MDVSIGIVPLGDTTEREVAELADELREAVAQVRGVTHVGSVEAVAPLGAKGLGETLGAFLVSLPAGVVPGIIEVLKNIVTRPAQPPVQIELTAGSTKVSFDPRQLGPAELAALVDRIRPKGTQT